MKIIDLLNKIANGEEVPNKIRVGNSPFELTLSGNHYSGNTDSVLNNVIEMNKLNDEVEIIEDSKEREIPKHLSNDFIQNFDYGVCDQDIKRIAHKVNEIINYLQYKEKKEKQED